MTAQYETVIGLEVHVELATKSKIFCGCSTTFGAPPNANTCPVCTGMPGTLPVLNKQVVEYALKAGLALNCKIHQNNAFDRKNYFYPDNPQNYQISQLYVPICYDGYLYVPGDGGERRIGIAEIHMEEDAGKLIHDEWEDCSLVDYNRSGVPLIEIVSQPDLRTADEVVAYLEKLRDTMRYLGVSDCKLQEGSMRADVNLSIRKAGSKEMGTRTEMKNLNSFKAIRRAIAGERERQMEVLSMGKEVVQETRRWDDNKEYSFPMRSKEDAKDYRYFPDPDLPPVIISREWLEQCRAAQPELREEKIVRYQKEFQLSKYDASVLTEERSLAEMFEQTAACCVQPKKAANWLIGETKKRLNDTGMEAAKLRFTPQQLAELLKMLDDKLITQPVAKQIFGEMFATGVDPQDYAKMHQLLLSQDDGALPDVVKQVLSEHPGPVAEYQEGKVKVLGFLIGQVMSRMKGKAVPQQVESMLKDDIGKL